MKRRLVSVLIVVGILATFTLPVTAQSSTTLTIPLIGLPIVDYGTLLTFIIRGIFVVAGLLVLIYGIMGALAWITSEGEKEKVEKARDKIQAAVVGIFIMVLVLTIIITLEQVIFQGSICFGISCDVKIPQLIGGSG